MFDPLRVCDIARSAMENILLPAWRQGSSLQVTEKSPGEMVTAFDIESQRFLRSELGSLYPDAGFLGEETLEEGEPDTPDRHQALWVVDPLDGTQEFIAGRLNFAVMIAFVFQGKVCGAWIVTPESLPSGIVSSRLAWTFAGGPVMLDGRSFFPPVRSMGPRPAGILGTKYFNPVLGKNLKDSAGKSGSFIGPGSAGVDILSVAEGRADYAIYSRTLPWDFAAPLYWGGQAGLVVRRFSGAPVELKPGLTGLLCARTVEDWIRIREEIIGEACPADESFHVCPSEVPVCL